MFTALIADGHTARAAQLRKTLTEANFTCHDIVSARQISTSSDVLFVSGDTPATSGSDELIKRFAQRAPGAPIVVVTEAPLWNLITLAVRQRAWMDVPKTEGHDDLLTRYATSRSPYPKIIIEASAALCNRLLDQWRAMPQHVSDLSLVHSLGDALEAVVDSEAPVLLNLASPSHTRQSPATSTLIYTLCPAVIAVVIEAYHAQRTYRNFLHTEPRSRFAVLKPPFHKGELKASLTAMNVTWPLTSPL